jgi:hypothetical protein
MSKSTTVFTTILYMADAIALEGLIAGRSPGGCSVSLAVSSVISETAI